MKKNSLLLLFMLLTTLGCQKTKINEQKNRLCLNITCDPSTLDPRKGADFTSSSIQFLLFEGLVKMTPFSTVSPALAKSYEVSEDRRTYTFHIREATWSNGQDVTAYDFAATFKEMLAPTFPCPNAHLLYPIKNGEKRKQGLVDARDVGIRAINYNTLEITLTQPTPYFLEMLTFCVFFPINQNVSIRDPLWAEVSDNTFVSNGPYKLKRWKHNSEIILEKNQTYWDKENVLLDSIQITIIDNELTALNMFENNQIHLLGAPYTGIPADSIPSLMDKGLVQTTTIPGSTICTFNMTQTPFDNLNLRKAFAYAIDRQSIVDNITKLGENIGPNLMPDLLSINDEKEPFFQDGDIERAKKFLQEALDEMSIKLKDLKPFELIYAKYGVYPKIAQALQQQWQRYLGIKVNIVGYEYKVFIDKLCKRDYQIGQCIWIAQYPDPMNFFERFQHPSNHKNLPGFDNDEYRDILSKIQHSKSKEDRYKLYERAEEIIQNEMPLTAIYHWKSPYLCAKNLDNLTFYPTGSFNILQAKIEEE